ncbi:MAG: cyclic nucleotide-binding domain-containing protein [Candidatus Marinimicrobia bacterium]|nr:cyclic nucleotide-binding domain-containing protein [Candidatus Neomarinimicrobiota bacterium]MBL7029925.1 cyclic nucleotide-binding domain-containing protein [Candidatus Neomarinimicrobiota bacterium]
MVFSFFFFSFFLIAMGMVAKTARDSYFLSRFDKEMLPLMFLAVAIIIAPILTVFTKLSKKFAPRIMFMMTCILFAGSFFIIQPFISGVVIPIVYIWVEVAVSIMLIQFWMYAGESFEPQQAKRLFGIIAGGGSFAVMIIGMNLKPFVNAFGTDELLWLAAVFLIIALIFGLMSLQYLKKGPVKKGKPTASKKEKKKHKPDPFLIGIGSIIALSAIVTTLVDYQFKMVASDAFTTEASLVSFFGTFYSIAGAASIIMQFFITGPILSRFGILIGLLALPFFLIAGSAAVLIAPVLMSVSIAKFSDQTFKFTINSSSMELLWLPVPSNIRKTIKPQITGTVKSIAEGVGGLVTFLLVKIIALQFLSIISLASIVVWIFTAIRVKTGYVTQLQSAIAKRQIDFEELNVDVQDAAMVKTIEKTLSSKDEIQQLFALEIIEGLPLSSWEKSINRLFAEGSIDVRKRILSMAWDEETILSNEDIIAAMKKEDAVSAEAIMVAGRRKLTHILPELEPLLTHEQPETRAVTAAAILHMDEGKKDQAETVLAEMLESDDESTQAIALNRLVHNDSILPLDKLILFLKNEGYLISNVALSIAEKRQDPDLIPAIISNLNIPKTSLQARQSLKKFSDDLILEEFQKLFSDPNLSRKLRLGMIRTLREYPNDESINMLLSQLNREDQDVYNEGVDSLLAIARIHPIDEDKKADIGKEISAMAQKVYVLNEAIHLIPDDENKFFLQDHLNNEIQNTLPTLLKLGVLDVPDTPIETYIHTVKSGDPDKLPFLLEFFENIFSKEEREIINPLIEPIPLAERSEVGHSNFKDLPTSLDQELTESVYSPNKWESVIALDYLLKSGKMDVMQRLDWEKVPASKANQELLTRRIQKNGTNLDFIPSEQFKLDVVELSMYSTLEKTIILKSVDLFKSIPAENLSRVAQITEEVQYDANEPIFAEGDYGDSLFIVVNGKVKIHKGEQELAMLGKGTCLGEMALLDDEPRSADATVTEDSVLFKIEQEGFYEVMGSQSDIMEGIIKLLTGRLRVANDKLMAK